MTFMEIREKIIELLINERIFKLNDIKSWKLYLKLIFKHINYLFEINKKGITSFLQDVIKEVKDESKKIKRRMGDILGDWRCF